MVPVLNSLAGMVIFGAVSMFCLMKPKLIQRWTIQRYDRAGYLNRVNPFRKFVETPEYILSVQVTGALAGIVAGMCAYALIANILHPR
jgi:hypothetical protein